MKFNDNLILKLKCIISDSAYKNVKNKEIANALGLNEKAFSIRKARNSIPLENIVEFCLKKNIDINYILSNHAPKDFEDDIYDANNRNEKTSNLIQSVFNRKYHLKNKL